MAKAPTTAPISAPSSTNEAPDALAALTAKLQELADLATERATATDAKLAALEGKMADLTKALEIDTAAMLDGAAEFVPGDDARVELLKVHRQLEAVANHLNIRLPS